MSTAEYRLTGLSTDLAAISSPLLIQIFEVGSLCSDGCNVDIILQNRNRQSYKNRLPVHSFSTTCKAGKKSVNEYECSSGSSSIRSEKVVAQCNGGSFNGVEVSLCPTNITRPVCYGATFDSTASVVCDTNAYTTSITSCSCNIMGMSTPIVFYSQKKFQHVNSSSYFTKANNDAQTG